MRGELSVLALRNRVVISCLWVLCSDAYDNLGVPLSDIVVVVALAGREGILAGLG